MLKILQMVLSLLIIVVFLFSCSHINTKLLFVENKQAYPELIHNYEFVEQVLENPESLHQLRMDNIRTNEGLLFGYSDSKINEIIDHIKEHFCCSFVIEKDIIRPFPSSRKEIFLPSKYHRIEILNKKKKLSFMFHFKNNRWKCYDIETYNNTNFGVDLFHIKE